MTAKEQLAQAQELLRRMSEKAWTPGNQIAYDDVRRLVIELRREARKESR